MIRRGTAVAAMLALVATPLAASAESDALTTYVVVLEGPGTAGDPTLSPVAMLARQAATRSEVGAGAPLYSWTTALNGYAVRLTPPQANALAQAPGVARVQVDRVQPVSSTPDVGAAAGALRLRGKESGRGTVIGVVDTGIDPDGPVFADSPSLGPRPAGFRGACPATDGWSRDDCGRKIVAATHYVEGFGADRLRNGAAVSPYDEVGHGTQVASLAAGNRAVSARESRERLGRFGGTAPDARLAIYKACWQAPDPDDDGCATSDLVAAVDQATSDGVDVLLLATQGTSELDVLDLALLGAAESDTVVVAAAGNDGRAGHAQPWVTTVGSSAGPVRTGRLTVGGTTVRGVMTSTRTVGPARIVSGTRIPAPGRSPADARHCLPGSLDAARAADRIVVCLRGRGARVDKSRAVALADGVGMVLVNRPGESATADFHAVPTIHLGPREGRSLLRADGRDRARMAPLPVRRAPDRLAAWSPRGVPDAASVKPDLVAPGTALLAATSPAAAGRRWDFISGSSASAALVAGLAARLRSAHPKWSAALVRSALVTTATAVDGATAMRQGAGLVAGSPETRLGLDLWAGDYRKVLEGRWRPARLNLPSLLVEASSTTRRTVTNLGKRPLYWSAQSGGFERYTVVVTPAAVRLEPGESATFTVRVSRRPGVRPGTESGWVAWLGADGTLTRIPVVVRGS